MQRDRGRSLLHSTMRAIVMESTDIDKDFLLVLKMAIQYMSSQPPIVILSEWQVRDLPILASRGQGGCRGCIVHIGCSKSLFTMQLHNGPEQFGKVIKTCKCHIRDSKDVKGTVQPELRLVKVGINRTAMKIRIAGKCRLSCPKGHHHERSINILGGCSTF